MSEGVNKAILIGHLGKDPETSHTQGGATKCRFPLATTESYTDSSGEKQSRTEWHTVIAWGKLADIVAKYLKKGSQAYVEGRIQNRSYDDKNGVKKYISEINALRVTFLGARGDSGGGNSGGGQSSGASDNHMPHDDDIPF